MRRAEGDTLAVWWRHGAPRAHARPAWIAFVNNIAMARRASNNIGHHVANTLYSGFHFHRSGHLEYTGRKL